MMIREMIKSEIVCDYDSFETRISRSVIARGTNMFVVARQNKKTQTNPFATFANTNKPPLNHIKLKPTNLIEDCRRNHVHKVRPYAPKRAPNVSVARAARTRSRATVSSNMRPTESIRL